ncbi:hypothetical protein K437DRAFT_244872 [Tilletiaria anomala UBC 951]|uniref:A1 cistron-splicing factor n=1 Tax=Tilletiaria anomala (strain ATCC 24038 / CBS 436.72 / UBC 951) TaxID=1037660 RepID=A0A066WIN5_TILAU|nr:uncharacterized protein K437DRAFT_244872 [Tilletiaria anomala UBC 951]KDN50874.1 hypothetical protein K437DRAFT_244872 [Tilletiaria anomala UBC 951]
MSESKTLQSKITSEQARRLFERNAFLIINDLPRGSQITIDGLEAYITDTEFQGFKLLPAGWHLVAWTAASTSAAAAVGQEGLRCAFFRYFDTAQVVVRRYDAASDRLVHPEASPPGRASRSSRSKDGPKLPEGTVASLDHLRSLDHKLAPYPLHKLADWTLATQNLQSVDRNEAHELLTAIIGRDDESGDYWTDALASVEPMELDAMMPQSSAHGRALSRQERGDKAQAAEIELDKILARGRQVRQFGKQQEDNKRASILRNGEASMPSFADEPAPPVRLPVMDVRRSWPPGATGQELTRWCVDKSWLLISLAQSCQKVCSGNRKLAPGQDFDPILVVFELSFLLFVFVQNSVCMSYWNDFVTLFCNAPALLGAPGDFEEHPAYATDAAHVQPRPSLVASFLRSLCAQFNLLPEDFFSSPESRIEGMQEQLTSNLAKCRTNVARALAASAAAEQENNTIEYEKLLSAWRALSNTMRSRFGIELERELDEEVEVRQASAIAQGRGNHVGLDEDIELEKGEDAPVVVEL